jgi:hypothetical protein
MMAAAAAATANWFCEGRREMWNVFRNYYLYLVSKLELRRLWLRPGYCLSQPRDLVLVLEVDGGQNVGIDVLPGLLKQVLQAPGFRIHQLFIRAFSN